ncbi:MAG: hypothetical protein M1536_02915, partial [Firmicutes bacterium]|nr:hypothetical protein [Bacillota bacterium]
MSQPKFFSFGTALIFEKECNIFSQKLVDSINKIRNIQIPLVDAFPRAKKLDYVSQSLDFFKFRSEFILDNLEKNDSKYLEILRTLIRGLMEIYCRIIFLKNVDEIEAIKRIIWQDLFFIARVIKKDPYNNFINQCYKFCKQKNINIPLFDEICLLYEESVKNIKLPKKLDKFKKEFDFPSVRSIVVNYLDEKNVPKLSKYYFYHLLRFVRSDGKSNS